MSIGKRDLEIYKGDDYAHTITLNTRTGSVLTPINTTGRTYTAQLRKVKSQVAPDATLTCTVTDGPNGVIVMTMARAITQALRVDCYYWDLQQTSSGVLTTILAGKVKVVSDTTR